MVRLRIKGYSTGKNLTVTLTSTDYNFTGYGSFSYPGSICKMDIPNATVNEIAPGKDITYTVSSSDVLSDNTTYMVFDFPIPACPTDTKMKCKTKIVSDNATYNINLETEGLEMTTGKMKIYDINLGDYTILTGTSPTGGSGSN